MEKYLKIAEYLNIYSKKLFLAIFFSTCSEVHFKINFVFSKMKVYLVKFFIWNIHEATSLSLEK